MLVKEVLRPMIQEADFSLFTDIMTELADLPIAAQQSNC